MKKFYLILILAIIWQTACGTEAAKNENIADNNNQTTNVNAQNTDLQNTNVNSNQTAEKPQDEEVPRFENAEEALKKGTEYFDTNKIAMAIDALRQATELDPNLAEAHFKLGVAYALEESADDPSAEPEKIDPEATPTPKSKGNNKPEEKNSVKAFENAVKAYKKFIRKNPKDATAHFNLGRAYVKLFEDQDARKALEQAVKLNDEDSLYRTELGAVLIKLAKYPEAIKQLNKAIEIDEDNARAEDLLEQAQAGRKRVDFGANKKAQILQQKN
jgi:tetratricopeptide (TPR) repeat protein